MRTGDTVKHIPSGETWIVAWAGERELMPCGWPCSYADLKDCILLKSCTDEQYWKIVREVASIGGGDPRGSRCQRILEEREIGECAEMMHL